MLYFWFIKVLSFSHCAQMVFFLWYKFLLTLLTVLTICSVFVLRMFWTTPTILSTSSTLSCKSQNRKYSEHYRRWWQNKWGHWSGTYRDICCQGPEVNDGRVQVFLRATVEGVNSGQMSKAKKRESQFCNCRETADTHELWNNDRFYSVLKTRKNLCLISELFLNHILNLQYHKYNKRTLALQRGKSAKIKKSHGLTLKAANSSASVTAFKLTENM